MDKLQVGDIFSKALSVDDLFITDEPLPGGYSSHALGMTEGTAAYLTERD